MNTSNTCHKRNEMDDDIDSEVPESGSIPEVDLREAEMKDILSRLNSDAELHKLLSDERMRCETHKANYAKLKSEYMKAVAANQNMTAELAGAEDARGNADDLNDRAHESIAKLTEEIDALRALVPSEADKLDLENKERMRSEARWRAKLDEVIEDLEASKLSVHNLLQDNLCLRASMRHERIEGERALQECRILMERKLKALEKANKSLLDVKQPKMFEMEDELNKLASDNVRLRSKVKFLESSLDDVSENLRRKDSALTRLKAERAEFEALLTSNLNRIEAEKLESEAANKKLDGDLSVAKMKAQEDAADLSRLAAELKDSNEAKLQMETQFAIEKSSIRMEIAREKCALQKHIDNLAKQLHHTRNELARMANENERIRNETERSRKNLELETAECRDKELTRLAEAEARVAELEAKNRNLLQVIHDEKVSKSTTPEALEMMEDLRKELMYEREKSKALEESAAKQQMVEMDLRNELFSSNDRHHHHQQVNKRSLLEKCSAIEKSVSESSVQVDIIQKDDEVNREFMRLKKKYDELLIKHRKFAEFFKVDPLVKSPQKKVAKRYT